MRGMRQASNRAAKTAISFQCWVQESERGMFTSWIKFISTVSIYIDLGMSRHNRTFCATVWYGGSDGLVIRTV